MIVYTPHGRILLTDHALQRFKRRAGMGDVADVAAAVQAATVQPLPPTWTSMGARLHENVGWLVAKAWACPLRLPEGTDRNRDLFDFAALTCITRKRRSKAEVRALRELEREERSWAA